MNKSLKIECKIKFHKKMRVVYSKLEARQIFD